MCGYKMVRGGGASEVLPPQKEGAKKVLAMLKGGTTSFGVILRRELDVLVILKVYVCVGGGGGDRFYPDWRGLGATSFGPMIFPFCSSLPPPCNQ